MSKVTDVEKKQITNYTYDEATHELFAIEGTIIDYKIAINNKKAFLKDLKLHKDAKLIAILAELRMQIKKHKTTYDALATNDELSYFEKVVKRKEEKAKLKAAKNLYKAAKQISTINDYDNYLAVFNASDLTPQAKKEKLANIVNNANKLDKTKEIQVVEKEILSLKAQLSKYIKDNKEKSRLLRWQKLKTAKYNRLAEEKKAIIKLDKTKDSMKIKEIKSKYTDKLGKVLKYQPNSISYYLMLLVVLFEIIYVIVFLNKMYVSYMEFPTLIINLIFTLFLFLSAMKVKVYNKTWTIINFIYSAYLLVRMIVIIPWIAKDHAAILNENGEIVQNALNYADLRLTLYILSGVMLALILFANIRSALKIKQRTLHLD